MCCLMFFALVSREVWLAHGFVEMSRSGWCCQLRLLVQSFILLKQIQGSSRGSSAALVNCRCCKEKDVVAAGSDNESGGSRCLV